MKTFTKTLTSTLAVSLGLTLATNSFAQKMYWSESSKIQRSDLDGSNAEELITSGSTWGIALDLTNSKMYWSGSNIRRSDLDGSNVENIHIGVSQPRGIALDLTNSKVYWADDFKIERSDLDGSNVEVVTFLGSNIEGIALDLTNSKIYWTDSDFQKIQRSDLDGSNAEDVVTGLAFPRGIALDLTNSKIYWADEGPNSVKRSNLDGSNIETVVTVDASSFIMDVALDVANSKMYFAVDAIGTQKAVQRSNLDGSNVEDLVTGFVARGIALGVTDSPLSVELNSFQARQIENTIQLDWTTASEKDNEGFNVYRKTGNGFFTQIASYKGNSELVGALNSTISNDYTFVDNSELRNGETYTYYISDVETNGLETTHEKQVQTVRFTLNEEIAQTKLDYVLAQNFPNPFNPSTTINFQIAKTQDVRLQVYNLKGEMVKELVNNNLSKGSHSANWDGTDSFGNQVSSGTYFYKISAGTFTQTNRMVLLK